MTPRKAAPAQPRPHLDIIVEGCDVPLDEGIEANLSNNKKLRDVNDNVNRL